MTLLAQARLSLKFWWDSFVSSVYLINRLSTPVLNQCSPYQKLYSQKPNYSFLRVFGCTCYPYLRPYNYHKSEFGSSKYVFLGYSPSHKRYRCLMSKRRLYIARSVVFDESDFPYESLYQSKSSTSQSSRKPSPISFSFSPIGVVVGVHQI